MKGVILSIDDEAKIVDLTHAVPPQDIRQGALVLAETTPFFPPHSIHVAVVDPGVGSDRELLYAQIGDQHYVLPDNGLLSALARRRPLDKIIALRNSDYWRAEISATFHGRDIMAPVAAHLGLGISPEALGSPQADIVRLDWPETVKRANQIEGSVESVDSFGNLITEINEATLEDVPRGDRLQISCNEHQTQGIYTIYADQPEGMFLALIGSSGKLELSIVGENAHKRLGIAVGTPVVLRWD